MLRSAFIVIALIVGSGYAVQGPLYAACLYLWIAYFRPESWAWNDVFSTLNLSFIAGIFLLIRTVVSPVRFRVDFRNGLLLAFLAHSLLSSVVAPHSDYSMIYLQEFAKTIIVSYLLSILITTEHEFRVVIMVIALSLGFEAGKQGWAQLLLNPGGKNDNPVPFLGDNNLVAVGMSMLLPMVGSLAATSTGWMKRGFQFLSIGVMYRAISTYSRGGLLAVGAVGALYFWRSPNKLRTVIAFAIAVAVILPVLPQAYWDRMSTITASGEERDESSQGRLHFWKVATAMAIDRPLTGVGFRGYEPNYNAYDSSGGYYGGGRAVHSSWFGILGDLGLPGFALFMTIFVTSWWAFRRIRLMARRGEVSESMGKYAIGMEAALIAFGVGGSFVSYMYNEMLWHFFALSMALEHVAVTQAAALRARPSVEATTAQAPLSPIHEPDFVWE